MATDPLEQYLAQRPLTLLDTEGRMGLQGKWMKNGHEFLRRCAYVRGRHDAALQPLPFTDEDIGDASARVALLERALLDQQRLCQQIADTLLAERAAAYGMGRLVLQTTEALGHLPHLPPEQTAPLRQAAAFLRFEFDARRRKIAIARRRQALASASAADLLEPPGPEEQEERTGAGEGQEERQDYVDPPAHLQASRLDDLSHEDAPAPPGPLRPGGYGVIAVLIGPPPEQPPS